MGIFDYRKGRRNKNLHKLKVHNSTKTIDMMI